MAYELYDIWYCQQEVWYVATEEILHDSVAQLLSYSHLFFERPYYKNGCGVAAKGSPEALGVSPSQ